MSNTRKYFFLALCLIIASIFITSLHLSQVVVAQSEQETWTTPVNLSNSGGASAPAMVIDESGVIHVLWLDEFYGTLYTRFQDQYWSDPIAAFFPFGEYTPYFVVNNGYIHAIWINEQGQLIHSFVISENFPDAGGWFGSIQLAESAVDFDAVFDHQGRLHVAYVRTLDTPEFPAGVYYRLSEDDGANWTLSSNIYSSPYFRSITSDQVNVDVEAAGDPNSEVYLSWDNRARKQVYSTRSLDGGNTWDEEQVVDSPTVESPGARPVNIQVVKYSGGVLRLWQDGDPAANCRQYYQSSTDGGNLWGERKEMLAGFSGCPQEQYFFHQGDLLMLMTSIQGQVYLLAWDGTQWSFPQPQPDLIGFQDPTTFSPVSLDCRTPGINQSGVLTVIGCDTGGGGDIWITDRIIGDAEEWFPPDLAWTDPELVNQSATLISSPILLADSEGRMHAFWSGQETGTGSNADRESIVYSRRDSDAWTPAAAVLQSPSGVTRQPAAAIDANDNLYVVWSGGQAGEIYFSRASGNRANSPVEWVEAVLLPSVRQVGASPDIEIAADGVIYVVYSIPLNEQRGVFLTKSEDGGTTWTEPVLAFDAVQAGWDMVDKPHIVVSQGGEINLLMTKFSLPGGQGPLGLYARVSSDGGVNWSEVRTVAEKQVLWSDLMLSIGGDVFRSWLESSVGGNFFQYQISKDQGINWTPAASISTIGEIIADPALSRDVSGQIYLVQAVSDASQGISLRNWRWDGTHWQLEEDLQPGDQNRYNLESVAAAVSPQGRLGLIYSASIMDSLTDSLAYTLEFSDRGVEIPAVLTTSQPEPTPRPTGTPTPKSSALSPPTPTIVVPTLPAAEEGAETSSNLWMGLALGAVLAGVITISAILLGIINKRRS